MSLKYCATIEHEPESRAVEVGAAEAKFEEEVAAEGDAVDRVVQSSEMEPDQTQRTATLYGLMSLIVYRPAGGPHWFFLTNYQADFDDADADRCRLRRIRLHWRNWRRYLRK